MTQHFIDQINDRAYYDAHFYDHGNSDIMINSNGSPNTAHTINPVPIIIIDDDVRHIENGVLADVAPTILNILGIEKPLTMTGKNLTWKKNY